MFVRRFASEQELARQVVMWLQAQHWDIYQEVSTGLWGGRADIVAVQGKLSWVVETKMSLGLNVMAQAFEWIGSANFVSVAVPLARESRARTLAKRLLRERGIGVIECDAVSGVHHVSPRLIRRIVRPIREILCDAHKTMAEAGSSSGGYATPFALTCRVVQEFVVEHPGCTMRELVDAIEHHYGCDATARACLRKWLGTKKIPDVEQRDENGRWRLFPIASEEESRA